VHVIPSSDLPLFGSFGGFFRIVSPAQLDAVHAMNDAIKNAGFLANSEVGRTGATSAVRCHISA
jgi:hypothetical protein